MSQSFSWSDGLDRIEPSASTHRSHLLPPARSIDLFMEPNQNPTDRSPTAPEHGTHPLSPSQVALKSRPYLTPPTEVESMRRPAVAAGLQWVGVV